mmetsp:Transcript_4031/g.10149  ORF Transcript_4031/g.10149 Transcript_4031/m.10149 type:complete len:115 (+) Transcript_4031:203-547(+)
MNALHSRYGGSGLRIVGVPTHQFRQEASSNEKIIANLEDFGVEFTVLEPTDVNGPEQSPLYAWLKEMTTPKDIHWNFGTYFLIDRAGNKVPRHDRVSPKDLEGEITKLLKEAAL